jgi:SAM-dependent methyltransferase
MAAEATRKKNALANANEAARLTTIQLDLIESAPLNQTFDLIIACFVMSHIENIDPVLGKFRSMLAPNGWLAIGEWGKPAAKPVFAIKNRTSDEWAYALAREFIPARIQCQAVHQFTRDDGSIAPALLITAGPVPLQ